MDVVLELEAECGEPIVSRAMADARPWSAEPGEPVTVAMELAESAVIVMSMTRQSARPPKLRERQSLHQLVDQVDRHSRAFRASIATRQPAGGAA